MIKILTSLIAILLLVSTSSFAEDQEPRWMFFEVMSPYCPGRALADCPTQQAEDLRDKMLEQVKAGKQPKEVIEEVIKTLGEDYRAKPKSEGFGIFAWAVPGMFLLFGAIMIFIWGRKNRGSGPN